VKPIIMHRGTILITGEDSVHNFMHHMSEKMRWGVIRNTFIKEYVEVLLKQPLFTNSLKFLLIFILNLNAWYMCISINIKRVMVLYVLV
jgi:hypothetical protein